NTGGCVRRDAVAKTAEDASEDPIELLFDLDVHRVVRDDSGPHFDLLDLCAGDPILGSPQSRAVDSDVWVEREFGGAGEGRRVSRVLEMTPVVEEEAEVRRHRHHA